MNKRKEVVDMPGSHRFAALCDKVCFLPTRHYTIIAIICLTTLFSCKHVFKNDHLPQSVMQKVLLDVSLAEAYSVNVKDSVHRGGIKNTDSLSSFYKTIFSHYKISSEEFNASLEWYKAHPEELDSTYNKMIIVAARWDAPYSNAPNTRAPAIPLPPNRK